MSKVGRPPIYDDSGKMAEDIEAYFEQASSPYTVEGLATALDMTTQTLARYQKKEKFCSTIEKAKQRILDNLNKGAIVKDFSATMVKFNLKNNFGWEDRKKEEITGEGGGPLEVDTGLDITVHKAREYESDDELDDAQPSV